MRRRTVLALLLAPAIGALFYVVFNGAYEFITKTITDQAQMWRSVLLTYGMSAIQAYILTALVLLPAYRFLGGRRDSPVYLIPMVLLGWFVAAFGLGLAMKMPQSIAIEFAMNFAFKHGLPIVVAFGVINGRSGDGPLPIKRHP
ncbi:MAG TPA: hypothetical protein VNJ47_12005 [Nevskiales bacterium]|nr:hypothetical protein [Nevskiales bacterium]